jgi:hypothetical protein
MGLLLTLASLFMAANAVQIDEKLNMDVIELLDIETHDEIEPLLDEDEYFDAQLL